MFDFDEPVLLQNETDLLDLEQKCRIMVEKKCTLERQLKETQGQVQELTLTKLDLERKLDGERREMCDVKAQLKLLQTAMQQWEHDRITTRDTTVKQKLQFESLITERNSLNELVKNLEVENMHLKSKVEDAESKLVDQKTMEKILETKKASINTIFETIFTQNRKIEREHSLLRQNVTIAKNFGEQMIKLLTVHHQALNRVYSENDGLKEKFYTINHRLNASNRETSHELIPMKNPQIRMENCLQEYESMILALDRRINEEVEEKRKLNDALKTTLDEQVKHAELEQYLKNRVSDLEKKVEQCECPQKPAVLQNTTQIE